MCHTLHRPKEFNNLFPLGPPSFTHPSQPRWAFNPRWKPAVTSREQRASCTNSCVCGRGTKPVGWPGRCWFSPLYLRIKSNVAHMAARKWRCLMEKHDQLLQRRKEKQQDDFELLNLLRLQSLGDVLIQPKNWRSPKIATQLVVFRGWFSGP